MSDFFTTFVSTKNDKDMDLFGKVLEKVYDGMEITFNRNNVAAGDRFLILQGGRSITCKFVIGGGGIIRVYFDGDEPMLLEDCPESFLRSILLNV